MTDPSVKKYLKKVKNINETRAEQLDDNSQESVSPQPVSQSRAQAAKIKSINEEKKDTERNRDLF
jgi:hypothetical protein